MIEQTIKNELNCKILWSLDGVFNLENDNLYIQVIYPHSGTEFEYVIRADFKETYCKWSNCFYEATFKENELNDDLPGIIKDLAKMNLEKDKMICQKSDKDSVYWCYTPYAESDWTC